MQFQNVSDSILHEISTVLHGVDSEEVDQFIRRILGAEKIVVVGAGRVGYAAKGFAMRLGHMGFSAYMLGDTTVPAIGRGDLLIAASGSGETQTIYDIVEIAHNNDARVALVTGNKDSRMGRLSDTVVVVPAPSKTKTVNGVTSIQPMTTLNEQCLGIFFDTVVLELMQRLGETHDTMWARHSNLE